MRPCLLMLLLTLPLAGCSGLFFYPQKTLVRTPSDIDLAYRTVYLRSGGHRLHGWLLPARGQTRGTVLFAHGNAENISTHIGAVYWLPEKGYRVFLFDYRGYGRSEGEPGIADAIDDIRAAIRHMQSSASVQDSGLVVYGHSLGASLAISAVAGLDERRHLRAVIADSAFTGYRAIAHDKLEQWWLTRLFSTPLSWLFPAHPSPVEDIDALAPLPVLIMHAEDDGTIPVAHARRLFRAAGEPKALWLLRGVGHNHGLEAPAHRRRFLDYLERFFNPDGIGRPAAGSGRSG